MPVLPAADEVNDFEAVAVAHGCRLPHGAREDFEVVLDGDALGGQAEMRKQRGDIESVGKFAGFAVDGYGHGMAAVKRMVAPDSGFDAASAAPKRNQKRLRRRIDRAAPGRYDSVFRMSGEYLQNYAPLAIHLLVAMTVAGALLLVSWLVGQRRPSRAKLEAYECGVRPTGDAREPFSVKFYLVAMLFILFDVEAVFLYPWAYVFRDLHWFGFVEMMIYILILLAGYIYLWKKGALDWNR